MSSANSGGVRPWQLDWKRPVWQACPADTEERTTSNNAAVQGQVVDHVAAAILPHELRSNNSNNNHDDNNNVMAQEDNDDPHSLFINTTNQDDTYILTVSLVQSRAAAASQKNKNRQQRRGGSSIPVADVLLLEVLRQTAIPQPTLEEEDEEESKTGNENRTDRVERIESRVLRWPASALWEADDDQVVQETTDEEPNEQQQQQPAQSASLPPFLRWMQGPQKQKQRAPPKGIVAVSLCRMPVEDPMAAEMDAMDVLHLLSLGQRQGLSGTQQEWLHSRLQQQNQQQQPAYADEGDLMIAEPFSIRFADGGNNNQNNEATTTGSTDLQLVCLTNTGKVHFYSPWSLLHPTLQQEDQVEDSMASLLLGDQLLSVVQNSMLPLSQPVHTLRLSLPFFQKAKQQEQSNSTIMAISSADGDGEIIMDESNPGGEAPSVMTIPEDDEEHSSLLPSETNNDKPSISVWDPSLWDSILDKPSLPFQTRFNVATHSVVAMEYLCIAGRGRRRTRRRHYGKGRTRTAHHKRHASHPPTTTTTTTTTLQQRGTQHSVEDSVASSSWSADWAEEEEEEEGDDDEDAAGSALGVGGGDSVATGASRASSTTTTTHPGAPPRHHHHHHSLGKDGEVPTANGGFVTFISLRSHAETRTVYVPFVPERLHPIFWGGMHFLMVLGTNKAVLIRIDSAAASLTVTNGKAPSIFHQQQQHRQRETEGRAAAVATATNNQEEEATEIVIRRFQILPILLPPEDLISVPRMVGCSATTTPPAIAFLTKSSTTLLNIFQRTLESIDLVPALETGRLFRRYGNRTALDQVAVVTTSHSMAHVAMIDCSSVSQQQQQQLMAEPWCHLGEGWCLVGTDQKVDFVCFQGATSTNGAFVHSMSVNAGGHSTLRGFTSDVLPVQPLSSRLDAAREDLTEISLPVTTSSVVHAITDWADEDVTENNEPVDNIVTQALQDISFSSFRRETVETSPRRDFHRKTTFTRQEKFARLLRHCSSWKQLDRSQQMKHRFEKQRPVTTVRLGTGSGGLFSLSLRNSSAQVGPAPFQHVLAWLSCQEDYFTASSLALDLLRDAQSLRHLWRAYDKMDDENEMSMLESLLDGVLPVYSDDEFEEDSVLDITLTQLADMTIGCMIKGGINMSSTLSHFVRTNKFFDPSRACIMLAAVTPTIIAHGEKQGLFSKEEGLEQIPDDYYEQVLWPVRSLFEVGTSRDCLITALLLLNATIPDELRCRENSEAGVVSSSSIGLCKALVSLVVASSEDAIQLLIDLVDEQSRKSYWESLDHPTRRELALLKVDGKYPMLRQLEVRTWAITELRKCIESEGFSHISVFDLYPNDWLLALGQACLINAGCELVDPGKGNVSRTADEAEAGGQPTASDDLRRFKDEELRLRHSLLSTPGSGGLDFDLFIPSMLILEMREVSWSSSSDFSTRDVLNSACYIAGRRSSGTPLFPMDGGQLMRECVLAGNVQAGANLVGGKNGLVLKCCYLLIEEVGMTMDGAERFLLSEKMPGRSGNGNSSTPSESRKAEFSTRYCHRLLLFLLDEHVLSIRKYGDFDTSHARGKVDPVFAARVILRTWWRITRDDNPDQASTWFIDWLQDELSLGSVEGSEGGASDPTLHRSPHRLACAALARTLLWSNEAGASPNDTLASRLRVPDLFLFRLSLSCCGLVEALPTFVVKDSWRRMEGSRIQSLGVSTPPPTTRRGSTGNTEPHTPPHDLDETFVSAVSSLVDM